MKYVLLILILAQGVCFAQTPVKITVQDKNGLPMSSVTIKVNDIAPGVLTDSNGEVTINLIQGNKLLLEETGYENLRITISNSIITAGIVVLTMNRSSIDNQTRSSSPSVASRYSSISGSLVFNAFEDSEVNDLISTVTMKLGTFNLGALRESEKKKFQLYLTGTLSDFSDQKKEDVEKGLVELAQQNQGLQVGFEPVYDLKCWSANKKDTAYLRLYAGLVAKYNSFTIPDSSSVGLPQFRITAGFEFEGITLIDDDKPINFHLYYYRNMFDGSQFAKVFEKERTHIQGVETGLIVPISKVLGLRVGATFSGLFKPIWNGGIMLWPNTKT